MTPRYASQKYAEMARVRMEVQDAYLVAHKNLLHEGEERRDEPREEEMDEEGV